MKRAVLLGFLCFAAACSKKNSDVSPTSVEAGASTSATLDASATSFVDAAGGENPVVLPGTLKSVKTRGDERFDLLNISDKLAVEKADRPKEALRVEKVWEAIESQLKVKVTNKHQVLGQTVKAGYCELADLEPSIDLAVCEYDDPKALAAGREPRNMFKIKNRDVVEWKLTTVAIHRGDLKPETTAQGTQIAEIVKKL